MTALQKISSFKYRNKKDTKFSNIEVLKLRQYWENYCFRLRRDIIRAPHMSIIITLYFVR